jgi:hypothetical protein
MEVYCTPRRPDCFSPRNGMLSDFLAHPASEQFTENPFHGNNGIEARLLVAGLYWACPTDPSEPVSRTSV